MSITSQITKDTDVTLTKISEKEVFEFLKEGLLQASDAASQLGELQRHPIWADISSLMDELHNNAVDLYKSKPLSRFDVLGMLDTRIKKMDATLNDDRPKKFIIN